MTPAFYQGGVQEAWSAGVGMLPGSLNQCREQYGGGKSAVCAYVCECVCMCECMWCVCVCMCVCMCEVCVQGMSTFRIVVISGVKTNKPIREQCL